MRTELVRSIILTAIMVTFASVASAAGPIKLPEPRTDGGKPLMQVLKSRVSMRSFSDEKLSPQMLSDLLWAGFGVSRADGRRTAPSARNSQEICIYVATPDGAFLWDAQKNQLEPVAAKDLRAMTGTQPYVGDAAVNLIYVADYSKIGGGGGMWDMLVGADTGAIFENVYLFCASEGLATVARAGIDRDALARELKLKSDQKIVMAQSVGYPKK
ncbi:MAG: SagB/ThcOx family dehydrogenase [Desulfobacteraceae bacterium]|nr:SagB/ThcOx family dehydrogenase [Desulfobacteraceae bacterium]